MSFALQNQLKTVLAQLAEVKARLDALEAKFGSQRPVLTLPKKQNVG
jgi:hypothetical protein